MAVTGVVDARDDATLIAAVRDGDTEAYGVLFERHADAARRLARSLARDGDADDLVSEAFTKVLPVLARGDGPDVAFRPYLLTTVRRLDVDRHRALTRTRPTDDEAVLDVGEPFSDTAVAGFESEAAARAFRSLPERWQLVLWHTEVEGQRPAEIAPLLGISANAVSQLAHRAREGLRSAFVAMHVNDTGTAREACQATRANLGAYIRAGLSNREASRVSAHLECCRECTAIYLELLDVDTDLRVLLAPLLLGGAAAAYVAELPVATAPTGLAAAGELLRSGPGKALAGTAAVGAVVSALVLGGAALLGGTEPGGDSDIVAAPPVQTAPQQAGGGRKPVRPQPTPTAVPSSAPAPTTGTGGTPSPDPQPTRAPTEEPTQDPTQDPTQAPTHQPTHEPTGQPTPTDDPTDDPTPDPGDVDVTVAASRAGIGPASVVTVSVTGLSSTQSGVLTVTADRLAATVALDPRCDLLGVNTASCRLSGPANLQLVAATLLAPTTLTLTATPTGGLTDSSTDNNTTRIVLGP